MLQGMQSSIIKTIPDKLRQFQTRHGQETHVIRSQNYAEYGTKHGILEVRDIVAENHSITFDEWGISSEALYIHLLTSKNAH